MYLRLAPCRNRSPSENEVRRVSPAILSPWSRAWQAGRYNVSLLAGLSWKAAHILVF